MKTALLDVVLITYNHEHYIVKALEGILEQIVDFEYQILIGEDHSTDGTRSIVFDYQAKYPEKIRIITSEKNVGAQANVLRTVAECNKKYIACLEGDDYWCDRHKLQKQVDLLEKNQKYSAICSDVFEITNSGMERIFCKSDLISINGLFNENNVYTCSVVYRNIISLPDWFSECKMGDWILWILLAQHGDIFCINEPMAVYRIHDNGLWSGKGKESNLISILSTYNILLKNMDQKYETALKSAAKQHYIQLLRLLNAKKSNKVFYWTFRAFKFDFDLKWISYPVKYFFGLFMFGDKSKAVI